MENLNIIYEQMIVEEDSLYEQIYTAELCVTAIIDYVFRYGDLANKKTLKEGLIALNQVEMNVRTEMLHLRLEKALIACQLK